jgi:hypothetical protein
VIATSSLRFVDLNKIELDIKAIPGTVLGDLFCQLAPPPAGT